VSVSLWDFDVAWLMLIIVILIFVAVVVNAVACGRDPSICGDSSS